MRFFSFYASQNIQQYLIYLLNSTNLAKNVDFHIIRIQTLTGIISLGIRLFITLNQSGGIKANTIEVG